MLRNQSDVSGITPMPTDRVDDASTNTPVSAETLTWFYLDSGAWASATAEAAGTLVTGKLAFTGVQNSMNSNLGSSSDTSFSPDAATRMSTLVQVPNEIFSRIAYFSPTEQNTEMALHLTTNGDYCIDHRRGQVWCLMKDTVADDAVSYDYSAPVVGSSGPSSNVAVTSIAAGTNTIGNVNSSATAADIGSDPFWDADGDNTAQVLKAGAGNLYSITVDNTNAAIAYIQLFNTAAGSVTPGTTTPVFVIPVPASGGVIKDFITPLSFSTAITYTCTTTPTGSGNPAVGLYFSAEFK